MALSTREDLGLLLLRSEGTGRERTPDYPFVLKAFTSSTAPFCFTRALARCACELHPLRKLHGVSLASSRKTVQSHFQSRSTIHAQHNIELQETTKTLGTYNELYQTVSIELLVQASYFPGSSSNNKSTFHNNQINCSS